MSIHTRADSAYPAPSTNDEQRTRYRPRERADHDDACNAHWDRQAAEGNEWLSPTDCWCKEVQDSRRERSGISRRVGLHDRDRLSELVRSRFELSEIETARVLQLGLEDDPGALTPADRVWWKRVARAARDLGMTAAGALRDAWGAAHAISRKTVRTAAGRLGRREADERHWYFARLHPDGRTGRWRSNGDPGIGPVSPPRMEESPGSAHDASPASAKPSTEGVSEEEGIRNGATEGQPRHQSGMLERLRAASRARPPLDHGRFSGVVRS